MKDTKMIRVTSRGIVNTSRGRVMSPIMSPYRESISRIWTMITTDRADVEEKLPDGNFVKLNAQNFDKDNFVSKELKSDSVKPEHSNSGSVNTFKNTDNDNQENKEEETPEAEKEPEPSVNDEEISTPEPDETSEKSHETETTTEPEATPEVEDGQENKEEETPEVNEASADNQRKNESRSNKRNRGNKKYNNNQSIAVDAEAVE